GRATEAEPGLVQAAGQRVVRELRGLEISATLQRREGAAMKHPPTSIAGLRDDVADLVVCEHVPADCQSIARGGLPDDVRPEYIVDRHQGIGFVEPRNLAQLIEGEPLAKYGSSGEKLASIRNEACQSRVDHVTHARWQPAVGLERVDERGRQIDSPT